MLPTLAPGEVIASRYRLERLIGEGGMGMVWAATHSVTRRQVALKFLKAPDDPSDRHRHRFLREARAASAVKHPNVVDVYDVLELDDGAPVMVMEFLVGESLQDRLDREGRIPLPEVCRILSRVTSAAMAAHAMGIVHRDLKPDNVFLAADGERGVEVKVLDFGIAKLTATEGDAARTSGLTGTGALLGTPLYMSPEQAFGESDIDARSDIWSMGIILYQVIAGVVPTAGDNFGQIFKTITTGRIKPLAELAPDTPPEILDVIARMLAVDRDARPSDLGEVAAVLARYAGASLDLVASSGAGRVVKSAGDATSKTPYELVSGETVAVSAPTIPSTPPARKTGGDSATLDAHDVPRPSPAPGATAPPRPRPRVGRRAAIVAALAALAVAIGVLRTERGAAPVASPRPVSSGQGWAAAAAAPPTSEASASPPASAPPPQATAATSAAVAPSKVGYAPGAAARPTASAPAPPSAAAPRPPPTSPTGTAVRVQREF